MLNWGQSSRAEVSIFCCLFWLRLCKSQYIQQNYVRNKGKCSNPLILLANWETEYLIFWSSPINVINYSVKLILFPDTFLIIIQVGNHDWDSDAHSCQSLTAKSTFSLHKNTAKNLTPNMHQQSLHKYICLPLRNKKKVGKHLHTHMTVVTKGKIRWSLNAFFKFLTLPQRQQKLKWKIPIYLLSAVLHHKFLIKKR